MAEYELTDSEAADLYGSVDAESHVTLPDPTVNSWGPDRQRADNRLLEVAILANAFRIFRVTDNADAIGICAGRATIDGVAIAYAEGDPAVDGLTNGDTTYIWLHNVGGVGTIGSAVDGTGWPAYPHVKLYAVTVTDGAVDWDSIVDYRRAAMFHAKPVYALSIDTQGDTGSPSRIHITGAKTTDYLRVRVCDSAGYGDASNATIAAAGSTTLAEEITADTDLVLKSNGSGLFEIDLTDATAETVTLRIGPAPISPRDADYTDTLDVVHAAP